MNTHILRRCGTKSSLIALVWLTLLLALGCFSTEAQATQEHSLRAQRGQVFLVAQSHRWQGALLVAQRRPYGGYHLRRVPSRQLYRDIHRIQDTLRKYEFLNRPHMPSMVGPITLLIGGGAAIVAGLGMVLSSVLRNLFSAPRFDTTMLIGVLCLSIGGAALIAGIIWLIMNIQKRRRSPYYSKIRKLKILQKAIHLELRQRRDNSYSALPPVIGHTFTFAF